MPAPVELFISYSHKDEALKKQLEDHLALLRRNGLIAIWHDRQITAGKEWAGHIDEHLNTAQVILLLVSAKFLASDYCYDKEMTRALERHKAGEAHVVPIILRPVDWELAPFCKLQALPTDGRPVTQWEDSDEAFTVIAQQLRKTIQELCSGASTPKPEPESSTAPRPPEQTPYFTGREEVLTGLRKALESTGRAALSGIPGVGKTQTALEYVHRYRGHYSRVLWTRADSTESLFTGFAALAGQLGLPAAKERDLGLVMRAVVAWLEANAGWLLILDNADDLGLARPFLPGNESGHVLLTTRAQATGTVADRIEIREMFPEEGTLFLLRRAKKIARKAALEEAPEPDRALAAQISEEMDGLPLALDQAGAFMEETQRGLAEYLDLYRREGSRLRNRRGRLATDHPSVAATFSVAFNRLSEENPAAADLIRCCAFLAPDAIAEEIFTAGAGELGERLGPAAASALAFAEAVEDAGRFSLIRRNPANQSLDIHRLIQDVVRDGMNQDTRRCWAERAVRAVAKAFPVPEYKIWPRCERLLPHAEAAAGLIGRWSFEFEAAAELLNSTGKYMDDRASLYRTQGRYEEAEPLYRRALAIWEKALGPDHPDTATSLNNLAGLYHTQGRYEKAERLYRRALAIWEETLGPNHPDTAATLDNLAQLYKSQGRYEEAEPLYGRALAIWEKALGPDHPSTATSLNNLAVLYHTQGRYEEAESLFRCALAVLDKALGPDHPHTTTTLNNVAALLRETGREAEAAQLEARAKLIRAKAGQPNGGARPFP